MPRVIRRTPETERAASYGYGDLLRDIVGKVVADTSKGFKRPLDFSDEEIMQMAFAGVGGGTKIAGGLGKGKFPFNLKTTDVPLWDKALKRPARTLEARGVRRNIEFMSKEEYFDKLYKGRRPGYNKEMEMRRVSEELVNKYAQEMREGAKFPMPALEYRGGFNQEGRHRVLAAEKLGIDRIPVLMMRELQKAAKKEKWKMPITRPRLATAEETPKEAAAIVEKYKGQGLTYDAFVNQLPDRPDFAYHQWTFRGGKGPLHNATLTTKGTSLDEFEAMVANRIKKFAE